MVKKVLRLITEEERRAQNMELVGKSWTICETIRQIYKLASEINDLKAKDIMERARTAVAMAKRMNKKLRQYYNKQKNLDKNAILVKEDVHLKR